MSSAGRIIDRFGGLRSLAKALGHRNPTTVQHWKMTGRVPSKHQQRLIDLGAELGVAITPDDFFDTTLATDQPAPGVAETA